MDASVVRPAAHDAAARQTPDGAARDGSADAAARADVEAVEPRAATAWSSYGHDFANTRDGTDGARINVGNVASLALKWSWKGAAVTSTPAHGAGTLFVGDWTGHVVALDVATGAPAWRTLLPQQRVAQITGSVSVSDHALFVGSDSLLYRLDQESGGVVWAAQADDTGSSVHVYSSPTLVADLVISGVASYQNINPAIALTGEAPFHGSVVAHDRDTGVQKWRFQTTDGVGVGVVSSAAIDEARGLLFVGTGQNYDTSDSPFADSLVALNYRTGAHVWHRQFTKGDQYSLAKLDGPDHDVMSSPLLFRVGDVDMVAAGDKGGSFFALDREGRDVWSRKLTPGGHHGGVMGSAAYHGGLIFVCSGDFTTDQTLGLGQDAPAKSVLLALHADDGSDAWTVPISGACYGSVSYAGGVVFLPTVQGELLAFHAETGAELWRAQLPESSAGGVSLANETLFVSYGWDWTDVNATGGVVAFGLP